MYPLFSDRAGWCDAAIHDQLRPRDVLCFVGNKEQHRIGNIPAIAHFAERHLRITLGDQRGGVIAAGSQVASIVPQEERLVVEVQITPVDVDTVRIGMPASIRLSHAAARTTPILEGSVERIAPDRLTDQRTGQPYFVARIAISADELAKHEHLRLQPGMHAEVLIRRGERSFASYLARPLADRFAKSMREF